jgi:hypothetical protein
MSGILQGLIAGFGSDITIVGVVVTNGNSTTNFPSGTATGDLAIVVNHGFAVTNPTGFTLAFGTSYDPLNYAKSVSYRVIQSGDTSVAMGSGNGFDGTLIVIRGRTSVSATNSWGYASGGGTSNQSVAVNGTMVAIASDRGATGYPSITSQDDNGTGTATFFYQAYAIKKNYVSGTSVTFTDFNDSYGTSCLMLVAT